MSRPTTLLLVRHGTTADTRAVRFPASSGALPSAGCAGLDPSGRDQVRALRGRLPAPDRLWTSHALRCVQTAAALGFGDLVAQPLAELAEMDFGRWAGRDPAEVAGTEPDALAAWYADPASAPHGGETLTEVRRRVAAVLARAAGLGGTTVAVTHGGFCKAALLEVLELPTETCGPVWQVDVAPGSVTELHHPPVQAPGDCSGRWRVVRSNWRPQPEGWPATGSPHSAACPGAGSGERAGSGEGPGPSAAAPLAVGP